MSGASKNSAQHTKVKRSHSSHCNYNNLLLRRPPNPHECYEPNLACYAEACVTFCCLQVNTAPNPLAKEELNLLAKLMGGLEFQKSGNADSGFRVNLFATDEEEE